MAARSAAARKGNPWTWELAVSRALKKRGESGKRKRTEVAEILVEKMLRGDERAIELGAKLSGWRPESIRKHEHSISRDLLVRPDGDRRGKPILDVQATPQVPASPEVASDSKLDATQGLLSDVKPLSDDGAVA
jgi:hypothetical protein